MWKAKDSLLDSEKSSWTWIDWGSGEAIFKPMVGRNEFYGTESTRS